MDFRKLTAVGLAAFVAGACGDDGGPGGSTGDELSTQERDVIAAEVVGQVLGGGFGGAFSRAEPVEGIQLAPPVTVTVDFDNIPDAACETSGNILYSGSAEVTFDQEAPGDISYSFDIIQDPNNCAFPAEELDLTVTVNGDPNFRMTGEFELEDSSPVGEQTIDIEGGFAWELSDGRSGSCGVDIQFVYTNTSASYQGQVCGSSWTFTATGFEI